jgi:hypothetical protein
MRFSANIYNPPLRRHPRSHIQLSPPSRPPLLIRNPLILPIAQGQVHILQALRRSALEQVIDGGVNNNALAGAVDGETTNLDAVLARDVLDERGLADDFDELFAGVAVLVEVADVAGCHCAVEGDGDGVLFWGLACSFVNAKGVPGCLRRKNTRPGLLSAH